MQQLTRTMIILWKWKDLNEPKSIDVTNVIKSSTDKIIRINRKKDKKGILLVIKEAKKALKTGDVFIFLHRNDGYGSQDVNEVIKILQNDRNDHLLKCFLFADGRDYIYFDTQDEGLLNQTGGFMKSLNYRHEYIKDGKLIKETIEAEVVETNRETEKDEVKLEHFDRVWLYYQGEFHKKINELLVDFISEFVDLNNQAVNNQPFDNAIWRKKIDACETAEKQYLNLRVKSFLGDLQPEDEEEILKPFEIEEEVSFVFDDCWGNLGQHEKDEVRSAYTNLFNKLYAIYDIEQANKKTSLEDFRDAFFELLESMK